MINLLNHANHSHIHFDTSKQYKRSTEAIPSNGVSPENVWNSGLKYKGLAKLTNWKKYDGDSVDLCGEVDIDGGEKKGEGVSSKKES